MRTTIDKAGRIVIPRQLREQVGLMPGEVDVVVDGAGVRIEPVALDGVEARGNGRLVIPSAGEVLTDDDVTSLRDADRR